MRKSRIVGLVLLAFLAWDSNAYILHLPLPSSLFWGITLPFALGFYAVLGLLLVSGFLEVKRVATDV